MKDLSFFILNNSLAAKMKKGLRSFCNGMDSTSTLNQHHTAFCNDGRMPCTVAPSLISSYFGETSGFMRSPPTLEDMILQLEVEEEAARKTKLDDYGDARRRMSCVNNSDILRSARSALNQYPRFSLDGRDAMYRSSFRNLGAQAGRKSVRCGDGYDVEMDRSSGLPSTIGGESVVWCKAGVVARLMGLEVIPLPISGRNGKARLMSKKANPRRIGRHGYEKRKLFMGLHACGEEDEFEFPSHPMLH